MFITIRKIRKLVLSLNAWVEPNSDPTEVNAKISTDLNKWDTAILAPQSDALLEEKSENII